MICCDRDAVGPELPAKEWKLMVAKMKHLKLNYMYIYTHVSQLYAPQYPYAIEFSCVILLRNLALEMKRKDKKEEFYVNYEKMLSHYNLEVLL